MVLAKKQKYNSMEQERKPINTSMYLYSICNKEGKTNNEGKTVSSINAAGKTGQLPVRKNEIRTFFNTIHKNKLRID